MEHNSMSEKMVSLCILRKLAPEVRKVIYDTVIDRFFKDNPAAREIVYSGEMDNGYDYYGCGLDIFAGLKVKELPELENALFPDTRLHGEFIAARVEASVVVLKPGLICVPYKLPFLSWPDLHYINAQVRSHTRVVKYDIP
jgi:hypothetical protein